MITIRCTRSRGPRGFFCLQDVRRGPVNVAVITLNLENDSSGETPLETTMMVTYTTRGGKSVVADAVALAYMSGALKDMLAVMHLETHPVDRHFLLFSIIKHTYKSRSLKEMRKLCAKTCELHVEEFPHLAPHLRDEMNGHLPRVPTFQQYSTLLTEGGNFKRAVEICELAISFGLRDGTKSGYAGRIERIRKKMNKQNKNRDA